MNTLGEYKIIDRSNIMTPNHLQFIVSPLTEEEEEYWMFLDLLSSR